MDSRTALSRLELGVAILDQNLKAWERREAYVRGEQDLPFAPDGVNLEYEALREQSISNWLGLAMHTPTQRLRVDGFKTGRGDVADKSMWNDVWQPNKLDARQRLVYNDMMVHDMGLMSVWPNEVVPKSPIIRVESSKRVHLEPDPEDPSRHLWAVKRFSVKDRTATQLWTPSPIVTSREVGVVYDEVSWFRYERENGAGTWKLVKEGVNPLQELPFEPFSLNVDTDGGLHPSISPLMPQQDAINTIRFNTLLAMQFSAFRQRVFTGYDPVLRDADGNVVHERNTDGTPKLNQQGQPIPVLSSPGRVGVDRALVFPGTDTKVFDLQESNLKNYIDVLGEFLTQFFATGQIPPQYLLSRMSNLSGDALAGAESTLAALVSDIQIAAGEGLEGVSRKANKARKIDAEDASAEAIWADNEARSFAQTIDAITKLISIGFPRKPAWEMIPGATITKVDEWIQQAEAEALDPVTQAIVDGVNRDAAGAGVGG